MKWAYQVPQKTKAAILLFVLIVAVLLTNLLDRKTYAHLDKSIGSIYKDRLMPATYLFELTNRLYQKQLLQQNSITLQKEHNENVERLIKAYDATYLTNAEKTHWNTFKNQWQGLAIIEKHNNADEQLAYFNAMHQSLQQLTAIQASEGKTLQKESQSLIGFTSIQSRLQISILIVLGIFAIVLVLANQKSLVTPKDKVWMN